MTAEDYAVQAAIVSRLIALHAERGTALVAIDGPGGAGKSTLARALANALIAAGTPTSVVHVDDFLLPAVQRPQVSPSEKPIGGDFDWSRLRDQVLIPLRQGESARFDHYDWKRDALAKSQHVPPGGVVIVEGIYASRRELGGLYDFRVWVECPREVRLARGLERDGETARTRWEQDWMVCEDRYMREHQPETYADVIVSGAA